MEEKPLPKPAMVSRLPKFGARPSPGGNSPQPNRSPQPALPNHEGKTNPPARPNGAVRASSFSLKWRKDGEVTPSPAPDTEACPGERGGDKAQTQLPSVGKDVKKASPSTPKLRSSGPSVPCSPKTTPTPKAIPHRTSPKPGAGFGWSPLGGGPEIVQNGSADIGRVASSRSCLARPQATTSSSPRSSSSGDSLSLSSDSLKSLTPDSMVRSQSFPHVKRIPSPTALPRTRSFSFTRAVELAKPLANTQLRPPRTSLIKSPQGLAGLGLGAGGQGSPGALRYSRESSMSVLVASAPPSALKKSLLPSCALSKPSALVYRLALPGWTKQQRPLYAGRVKGEGRAGTGPVDSPPLTPDPPVGGERTPGSGRLGDTSSQSHSGEGEGPEDMSLSSASSPEHNDDAGEELLLDDLDDGGEGAADNGKHGDSAQTRLQSFLNETMDLAGMGHSGRKEEGVVRWSRGVPSSEEGEFFQGSSLEMSPSNSSGGTYMWDEEGLEPMGGHATHPCDSCEDSDLNSLDILNNLGHLDPGDLDEDDLMLDVELPDDRSQHTDADGMAHPDRAERGGRQGRWRRRPHRWNGPDHCHNGNRGPVFQQYDGPGSLRLGSQPLPPVGRADSQQGALDQLTLRHMAQDCSSVKNQLFKLKSLLQMEDGGGVTDMAEASEENATAMQLEGLMKEVMALRDELKMKNRTIAQLTTQRQQLQQQQQQQANAHAHLGRCSCHQRAPSTRADKRTRYDKSTQTPWRGHGHTGALPAPLPSPWHSHHQGAPRASMPPQRRQTSSTTASQPPPPQPQPQRAAPPGKTSKTCPHHRGPQ